MVMHKFLSQQDQDAIRSAITQQEQRTLAELVTVITDASDSYRYIPVLWSSIIALLVPGLVYLAGGWQDFNSLYTLQVLLFLVLAFVFRLKAIKHRLIPSAVLRQRAARMAQQQFFEQRLHHTDKRLGVLLFVSVAEHYVEILVDTGVSDKIPDQQWQRIIQEFSDQVATGCIAEGFLTSISKCGDLLADAAPEDGSLTDILPNHLVILSSKDSRFF